MDNEDPAPYTSTLIARGVSHYFEQEGQDQPVLEDITYCFPPRKITVILGPSGCGKTTFLRCLAGLLRPSTGDISLDGMSPRDARKQGYVGFAFQSATLLPWRTALQNAILPLELLGRSSTDSEVDFARSLMTDVELTEKDAGKYPNELSGGMQQRVGLVRALVTKPRYLFLDEPFSGLDPITRDRLNEKVRDLSQKYQLTTVCVTHSVEEAVFLADHVIIFRGSPAQVGKTLEIELGLKRDAWTRSKDEFHNYGSQIREFNHT